MLHKNERKMENMETSPMELVLNQFLSCHYYLTLDVNRFNIIETCRGKKKKKVL